MNATPTNIAGVLALAAGVQLFFTDNGITAKVGFGWRARSEILNQGPGGASRVVFMPGRVDPNGGAPKSIDAGKLTQPRFSRQTETNPRPLRWWHQTVTVSIWGVAPAGYTGGLDLGDEANQYGATGDLFEATVAALHNAVWVDPSGTEHPVGLADLQFVELSWVQPPVEMGFGRELLVVFTHNGPLFDLPVGLAYPQAAVNRSPST